MQNELENVPSLGCLCFFYSQTQIFLAAFADDVSMPGRKVSVALVLFKLKKIDLQGPTPLINQVYLGRTQRESVTKSIERANVSRRQKESSENCSRGTIGV